MSASSSRRLLAATVPFLLATVLVAAACSSSATGSPSGGASGSPGASASQGSPAASSPGASGSAAASFDASALTQALQNLSTLDSYQAEITGKNFTPQFPDFKATAIVIRKGDVSASQIISAGGVVKQGVIYITSQGAGWITQDGKTWSKVPLPTATNMADLFAFLDPGVMAKGLLTDEIKPYLKVVGTETKNGQSTVHLTADASKIPASASFPPDGKADVWLSQDGKYLVAVTFSGTEDGVAKSLDYELTHINDSSLKVSPPS